MKFKHVDRHTLLIEDFPLFPGIFTFPACLFMLWKLIQHLYPNPDFDGDTIGMSIGVLMLFFATALFNERSVFRFRLQEQQLEWRRVGLLGCKGGKVPFSDITDVVTQTSRSDRSVTYRLAILADDGAIPMTRFYSAGDKEKCERIASVIRSALNKDQGDFIENSIMAMVLNGDKIGAIKLAQEHYRMDLTEAKQFVEGLIKD